MTSGVYDPFSRQFFTSIPSHSEGEIAPIHEDALKNIQEVEEFIATHSWLKGQGSCPDFDQMPPVDFKLLCLLNGDAFINGIQPLEGYSPLEAITYFVKFYKTLPPNFLPKEVSVFFLELEKCLEIAKELDEIQTKGIEKTPKEQSKLIYDYAKKLTKKLEEEKVLFMPGGWQSSTGTSHAMLYKIEWDRGVTIFNTGAGLHYHPQAKFGKETEGRFQEEIRSQQFLTLLDDKNRFHKEEFFTFLIEIYVRGHWHKTFDPDSKILYEGLANMIGEVTAKAEDPWTHPELYKKNQRAGSCAIKSIVTALYYTLMDREVFKGVKFLSQFAALANFCKISLSKENSREELNLLEDMIANLARSVDKSPLNQWLEGRPHLIDELNATILECYKKIDSLKADVVIEKKTFVLTYNSADKVLISPQVQEESFFSEADVTKTDDLYQTDNLSLEVYKLLEDVKDIKAKDILASMQAFFKLMRDECLKNTPSGSFSFYYEGDIKEDEGNGGCSKILANFLGHGERFNAPVFFLCESLKVYVKELILKDVWKEIPQTEILGVMKVLSECLKVLCMSKNVFISNPFSNQYTADHASRCSTFVLMYAILSAQETLTRRLHEKALKGFRLNYLGLLDAVKKPTFYIDDPAMQEIFKKIMVSFDPTFNLDTLTVKELPKGEDLLFFMPIKSYGDHDRFEFEFTNTSIEKNPTLRFLRQFVDEKKKDSVIDQVASLFTGSQSNRDMSQVFLPEELELLKNAFFYPFAFQSERSRLFDFLRPLYIFVQRESNPRRYRVRIDHLSPGSGYLKRAFAPIGSGYYFLKCKIDTYFKEIVNQNDCLLDQKLMDVAKEESIALEEFRELMMIGTDPNNEALLMLGFLKNHWSLLKEPNVQSLLALHLFRPLRLMDELEMSENQVKTVSDFFKKGLSFFFEANDMNMCLVLVNIGRKAWRFIPKEDFSFLTNILQEKVIPKIKDEAKLLEAYALLALLERDPKNLIQYINLVNSFEKETYEAFKASAYLLMTEMFSYLKMAEVKFAKELAEGVKPLALKLPRTLLDHSIFKTLCPGKVGEVKLINEKTYHLLDHGLMVDKEGKFFAKKIGDEWFSLIMNNQEIQSKIPSLFEERTIFCWVSRDKKTVLGMENNTIIFTLSDSIIKQGDLEYIPTLPSMECWGKNGKLEKIYFLESKLHFNIRNEKPYSKEFPGFFLTNEKCAFLKDLDHYVLENSQGEKEVIVPKVFFEVGFKASPFEREFKMREPEKKEWLEYSLKENILSSHKLENRLFLLSFYLAKGFYREAHELVLKINPLIRFSDKEREILSTLLKELAKDHHPDAGVLLIRLLLKVQENHLKYPQQIGEKENLIFTLEEVGYQVLSYFRDTSNRTLPLTEQEEKKIIDTIRALLVEEITKQGSDTKEAFLLKENLKTIETYFSHRLAYLEGGKAHLGIHRYENLSSYKNPDEGRIKEIESKFTAFLPRILYNSPEQYLAEVKEGINFGCFFVGLEIGKYFFDYYTIAKYGDESDKKELAKLLNFNQTKDKHYVAILEKTLKNPEKFPDLWELRHYEGQSLSEKLMIFTRNETSATLSSLWSRATQVGSFFTKQSDVLRSSLSVQVIRNAPVSTPLSAPFGGRAEAIHQRDKKEEERLKTLVNEYFEVERAHVQENKLSIPLPENAKKLVKEKILKENAQLEDVLKNLKTVEHFVLKKDIALLKSTLEEDIKNKVQLLSINKAIILFQANKIPVTKGKAIAKALGKRESFDFKELQSLFLSNRFNESQGILAAAVGDYMMQMTRLNQLRQVVRAIDIYEKNPQQVVLQGIAKSLLVVRHYDMEKQGGQFLPFELVNGYLYRKEQLDKLAELMTLSEQHPHLLAEMPTGWGKTKTIVPTLNQLMAKENKLLLNIWPASLEITNAEDVQRQMEESFETQVDRIVFNRQTGFSAASLQFLIERMEENKKLGKPVNARPETIRAIELHFLLTLHTLKYDKLENKKELEIQAETFAKFLKMMRTDGFATIDESHILTASDKLIYTLGESKRIPDSHVGVVQSLFEVLEQFESDFGITTNSQELLSDDKYKELSLKILNELLPKLKSEEEISLAKGLCSYILKSSIEGAVDESFGLSKLHLKDKAYAIPYSSSNTPKETPYAPSQYKNCHETLVKTYMTYLYRGLQKAQVKALLLELKEELKKSMGDGLPMEQCLAFKTYESFFSDKNHTSLLHLTESEMEHLELNRNKKAIYSFIRLIVSPQIKIFPKTLTSTVQNFFSQFAKTLSLSATTPDVASHKNDAHLVEMKGISGQVSHMFLTKGLKWDVIEALLPKEVLSQAQDFSGKCRATIDVGALFKGLSNLEVVESMKEKVIESQNRDVKGFVYFDEKREKFKVLYVGDPEPKDLEDCELEPEERHTYYDQPRTYGSDIKQGLDSVARLLFGKRVTKAKASQGAGRMRQGEGFVWMVQKPVADEIRTLYGTDTLESPQALGYMVGVQAEEEAQNNYDSSKDQMDNDIRNVLMEKILNIKGVFDIREALKHYGHFESVFVEEESIDPKKLYDPVSIDCDPRECLVEYLDTCFKRFKSLKGLNSEEKQLIELRLNAYKKKLDHLSLPETVKSPGMEMGTDCDVLEEAHVSAEVQEEAHLQKSLTKRKVWRFRDDLNLFAKGWESVTPVVPSKFKIPSFENRCPIFEVADVLYSKLPVELREVASFFSKNLSVTNNFYCMTPSLMETQQVPFTEEQKPLFHVLVIQDGDALKMMLIDLNDSATFYRKLKEDKASLKNTNLSRRVGIYDLRNGLIAEGKNSFKDLEGDKAFKELLVQAKLLNGEVFFDEEELKLIEAQLVKSGVKRFKRFFEEVVLAHHTLNGNIYRETGLAALLNKETLSESI